MYMDIAAFLVLSYPSVVTYYKLLTYKMYKTVFADTLYFNVDFGKSILTVWIHKCSPHTHTVISSQ